MEARPVASGRDAQGSVDRKKKKENPRREKIPKLIFPRRFARDRPTAALDTVTATGFSPGMKRWLIPTLTVAFSTATVAAQYAQTGSIPDQLHVGDMAPDFRLKTKDGTGEVQLSSFRGKEPVVLFFGSYTCKPFREEIALLEDTYGKFKDRAQFFLVYINEAHPTDGLIAPGNEQLGIRV